MPFIAGLAPHLSSKVVRHRALRLTGTRVARHATGDVELEPTLGIRSPEAYVKAKKSTLHPEERTPTAVK